MPAAPKAAIRHSPMEHPRHQYPEETAALQSIARACGLAEAIKWGKPCFTHNGKNIVLIQRFNHYIALMFFQGALLPDPHHQLHQIGDMAAPRQLRFTSVTEITHQHAAITSFIEQAIALEQTGTKLPRKPAAAPELPTELQAALQANPALATAFAALTPGRQKAYLFHIAAAKRPATRQARVEQHTSRILAGKGLTD